MDKIVLNINCFEELEDVHGKNTIFAIKNNNPSDCTEFDIINQRVFCSSFLLTKLVSDSNIYERKKNEILNHKATKLNNENDKHNTDNSIKTNLLDVKKQENLWRIKEQPNISTDNVRIDNLDDCFFELDLKYHTFYVETSIPISGRNIDSLRTIASRFSEKINIFYCSGFCDLKNLSIHSQLEQYIDELAKTMKTELTAGILFSSEGGNQYIKSVAISHQIGSPYYNNNLATVSVGGGDSLIITHEISQIDVVALAAAGKIHREWTADAKQPPIIISTPPFSNKHNEILELLGNSGANKSRVLFCNVIVSMREVGYWDHLLRTHCCHLCIDSFGYSPTFSPLSPDSSPHCSVSYPTDDELVKVVLQLCELGHSSHLLLSLSIFCKIQLQRYGGYGYSYLDRIVKPKLLTSGLCMDIINQLTCLNLYELLKWRLPLEKHERIVEKVICYICNKLVVVDADNHYRKFSFDYCSTGCLSSHRKNSWAKK